MAIEHLIVHEVHAPALIRSRRWHRISTQQADPLAAVGLNAQLAILRDDTAGRRALVDRPSFPAKHHVHAQIAETRSVHGNLAEAQSQAL